MWTLLDLGTGSADIPIQVVKWGTQRGLDIRVTAVDAHPATLAVAREDVETSGMAGCITLVQSDATQALTQFGAMSFDFVHAGMFLHHLTDEQVVQVLRQMRHMSRAGAVWNDLTRDVVSKVAVRLMTIGRHPMVRHDAIVSVAKGFTPVEAGRLARLAAWDDARYHRHLFGRFTLTTSVDPALTTNPSVS